MKSPLTKHSGNSSEKKFLDCEIYSQLHQRRWILIFRLCYNWFEWFEENLQSLIRTGSRKYTLFAIIQCIQNTSSLFRLWGCIHVSTRNSQIEMFYYVINWFLIQSSYLVIFQTTYQISSLLKRIWIKGIVELRYLYVDSFEHTFSSMS